jgi:hypothetical protein
MQIGYWVNTQEELEAEAVEGMVFQDDDLGVFRVCSVGHTLERFGIPDVYSPDDICYPARLIAINSDMNW